jgi:hypothetical protein
MPIKTDEKQIKSRLLTLRSAADICVSLRSEIPAFARLLEQTHSNLQHLAKEYADYEQNRAEVHGLREVERKPPQRVERVPMTARRKPAPIPTKPVALPDDPLGMTRALRNIQTDHTTPVVPLDSMHNTRCRDHGLTNCLDCANPDGRM